MKLTLAEPLKTSNVYIYIYIFKNAAKAHSLDLILADARAVADMPPGMSIILAEPYNLIIRTSSTDTDI